MKKFFLGILIGIILCSGIVYGANVYQSNTVQYSPTDASWEVSNVSEALNSLHELTENKSANIIYLGQTGKYSETSTFDVSKYNNYKNFTVNNFLIADGSISVYKDSSWTDVLFYFPNGYKYINMVSKTYDNEKGEFKITNGGWGYGMSSVGMSKLKVYLVY